MGRPRGYDGCVILVMVVLAALLAAQAPQGDKSSSEVAFSDVTGHAGLGSVRLTSGVPGKDYIVETIGTGVAVFDYDNDSWPDVFLPNGSSFEGYPEGKEPRPLLFRNRGDGTFDEVTRTAGVDRPYWGFGTAVGDYDNDGWTDLYLTAYGANLLYRNKGDGTFEDVSDEAGVADTRWGSSAAFSDFDGDGLLDLYVANYLAFDVERIPPRGDEQRPCYYRGSMVMCGPTGLDGDTDILYHNNGDGTFSDVTSPAGIRSDIGLFGLGVVTADYDADGDIDIYVANDATPNQLYRNRGDGTFDEIGALSGVAYGTDGTEQGSMGTGFGDYDGDGLLDIVVTNFSHQFYQLFRYAGNDFFEDVTFEAGLAEHTYLVLGWATDFFDFDNDGHLDLFFANGHVYPYVDDMQIGSTYDQRNQLLRNVAADGGNGRAFVDMGDAAGQAFEVEASYRSGGAFDYDRDGDDDLILTVMDGPAILLRNNVGAAAGWVAIRPVGRKSNRSGLGVRFELETGGRTMVRHASGGGSYLWSRQPRVLFGLGGAKPGTLTAVWPGGNRQQLAGLRAGREYVLIEGEELQEVER